MSLDDIEKICETMPDDFSYGDKLKIKKTILQLCAHIRSLLENECHEREYIYQLEEVATAAAIFRNAYKRRINKYYLDMNSALEDLESFKS